MICPDHPKYHAWCAPRSPCLTCWLIHLNCNPTAKIEPADLNRLLTLLLSVAIHNERRARGKKN